jgi:hypothetical protein
MSKAQKIIMALIALGIIGGGAFFILKPGIKDNFDEKQISIQQAEVERLESMIYQDTAGFSFEYPGELAVQEIELDDNTVYSSLEIRSPEGGKVSLRITDTKLKDQDEWQTKFEEKNVVISIKDAFLADLEARTVIYGAPKEMRTVAIENGVIYEIFSLADGGYFERIQEEIVNSFEFKAEVFQEEETPSRLDLEGKNEEIVLLEEIIE